MLKIIVALNEEKDRGRLESFKKKIFEKISITIPIIIMNSDPVCRFHIFDSLKAMIKDKRTSSYYMLFKVINGKSIRNLI